MVLERYQRVIKKDDINHFYKIIAFLEDDEVSLKNIETGDTITEKKENILAAEIDDDLSLYGNADSYVLNQCCLFLNFMTFEEGKEEVNKLLKTDFKDTLYFTEIDRFVMVTNDLKHYTKEIKTNVKELKKTHKYIRFKDLKDPVEYFLEKRQEIEEELNPDSITIGELKSDRNRINEMKNLLKLLSYCVRFVIRGFYIKQYYAYLGEVNEL